jgi:hypothetical protein
VSDLTTEMHRSNSLILFYFLCAVSSLTVAFILNTRPNALFKSPAIAKHPVSCIYRHSAVESSTSLQISSVSLDVSAIPVPKHHFKFISIIVALALLFSVFVKSYSDVPVPINLEGKINKVMFDELLLSVKLGMRVFAAKTGLLIEKITDSLKAVLRRSKPVVLDLDKWNVCVIQERELLNGNFYRYRMLLPDPKSVIPLFAGQEVSV